MSQQTSPPFFRAPNPELDQLRTHTAALDSFRQNIINLTAGRPDTHMMFVSEVRAAIQAPPTAGVPLPVIWPGNVIGPVNGGPGAQTLLPLITSHGTQAELVLNTEDRARLAGLLAAKLHPASPPTSKQSEPCNTPGCGHTEGWLDHYADDYYADGEHPTLLGWIALRLCGAKDPIRWWCTPACATAAIVAGGAELAAADRTAAAAPAQQDEAACHRCGCTEDNACPGGCAWVPGLMIDLCSECVRPADDLPVPYTVVVGPEDERLEADQAFAAALPQMMNTAVQSIADARGISPADVRADTDAVFGGPVERPADQPVSLRASLMQPLADFRGVSPEVILAEVYALAEDTDDEDDAAGGTAGGVR